MTPAEILNDIHGAARVLIIAKLRPALGSRFQSTGFPDLGPARYKGADGKEMLLVESAQSMANRLETACWDEATQAPVDELKGLPYVLSTLLDGKATTNSLLEAHRINSAYITNSPEFEEIKAAIGFEKDKPFDRAKMASALFKYDPSSLIHGIFLEKIAGSVRSPRALSAFIEASDVQPAASGGVKFDRVQPETGKDAPYGDAADGYGNVPFAREEFTGKIAAYFSLDLALLRGLRLPQEATRFLVILSFLKIVRFLHYGLRLRSSCDLILDGDSAIEVTDPRNIDPKVTPLLKLEELQTVIRLSLAENQSNFGPSPFRVKYSKPVKVKKGDKAEAKD